MAGVTVTGIEPSFDHLDRDVELLVSDELRKRVLAAIAQVKLATPVDTGRARNSWEHELFLDRNKQGQLRLDTYEVTNTTGYIEYLNDGSSRQAPANFIESAFLRYFNEVNVETYDAGE